ncbi:MAG: hypothetical protein MUC59_04115, partial [Saprospiraceae bacterium]|nr:hypothetical protein [Saprospiraceae bacterium]
MMAKGPIWMRPTIGLRNFVLHLSLFCSFAATLNAQIWSEDFNAYPNGTTQGPPKWTTNATDCDDGGNLNAPGANGSRWGVWSGVFTINDIEGDPCCLAFGGGGNDNSWLSQVIDIEDYCNVAISLEVTASGVFECDSGAAPLFGCSGITPPDNSQDQVVIEYSLDGGGWVQFGYVCGDAGVGTITTAGLNGSTLQIRFFAANKSNAEFYFVDNVLVTGTTAIEPIFAQIGPLCENDAAVVIPTTSTQGFIGEWDVPSFNPSGQGGVTTTINFTPNPGQCATTTDMDILVEEAVDLALPSFGPFCTSAAATTLPSSVAGVDGSWSGPGVSGNSFDPSAAAVGNNTITFTPDTDECANPGDIEIEVNNAATPMLGTASLCELDASLDLGTLEDPMFSSGAWSGSGVSGSSFDPTGLSGNVTLTFTSSEPCVAPASTTIDVNAAEAPSLAALPPACELDDPISLATPQDGVDGNWSGTGVSGNEFDPDG